MSKLNIKKGDIFSLKESLSDIPPNKEENIEITPQEAIKLMADSIKELRDKNYSFEEIANILTERNFPISARTLKNTLTKKRKYKKKIAEIKQPLDKDNAIKDSSTSSSHKKRQSTNIKTNIETTKTSSSSFKIRGDSEDI